MAEILVKMNISLEPKQAAEIAEIEKREDRPRTRILRRAIEEYLAKYRAAHPDFKVDGASGPTRMLKESLETDFVVMRGKRVEVVVLSDGTWRLPVDSDYEDSNSGGNSILD